MLTLARSGTAQVSILTILTLLTLLTILTMLTLARSDASHVWMLARMEGMASRRSAGLKALAFARAWRQSMQSDMANSCSTLPGGSNQWQLWQSVAIVAISGNWWQSVANQWYLCGKSVANQWQSVVNQWCSVANQWALWTRYNRLPWWQHGWGWVVWDGREG